MLHVTKQADRELCGFDPSARFFARVQNRADDAPPDVVGDGGGRWCGPQGVAPVDDIRVDALAKGVGALVERGEHARRIAHRL